MNKFELFEILRKLRTKPSLMKKLKIFAVVGVFGFLVTGALAVWAGLSALSYIANKTTAVIQSPQTATHIESLKTEVKGLRLQPLNCWGHAQTLMAVEPWLSRPALDNLKNLKVACIENTPEFCTGDECSQIKQLVNSAEGRII